MLMIRKNFIMSNNDKIDKFNEAVTQFDDELDIDITKSDRDSEDLSGDSGLESDKLTSKKSRPLMGISLAILLGIVSGVLWATITQLTGYSIGYAAIGVGFMVSLGFTIAGKGTNSMTGIISGVIAVFSILFGETLTLLLDLASYWEVSLLETIVSVYYFEVFKYIFESIDAIDLLFYFLAISAAYKNSFMKSDDVDIVTNPVT